LRVQRATERQPEALLRLAAAHQRGQRVEAAAAQLAERVQAARLWAAAAAASEQRSQRVLCLLLAAAQVAELPERPEAAELERRLIRAALLPERHASLPVQPELQRVRGPEVPVAGALLERPAAAAPKSRLSPKLVAASKLVSSKLAELLAAAAAAQVAKVTADVLAAASSSAQIAQLLASLGPVCAAKVPKVLAAAAAAAAKLVAEPLICAT